jgi:hypothetical protein
MHKNCQSEVLILFTMDVEPAAQADGRTSGPASTEEGGRRVREYAEALAAFGYAPTFFVHPELGETQAELFLELQREGAGLGLHVHTAKFAGSPRRCELGGLTRKEQVATLSAGIDMFEGSFGFRPRIFRPGCFSANDCTYGVLDELGFTGGSVSIPGRVWTDRYCVWAGAEPHPHYANDRFRQLPGELPFVDIPLSVDRIGGLRTHELGFEHYVDLRPGGVYRETEDSGRDHAVILRHIARQLAHEEPILNTVVIDVHNDRDFIDPETTSARQLRTMLNGLEPILNECGLRPVSATLEQAIERFRRNQRSNGNG